MDSKKRNLILNFVIGITATVLGVPLLYAMGVPTFDVVLTTLFGEGSIWALVFSVMLILLIILGANKVMKSST
ncbi:hypothetical protein [Solibacillus sp. FSL W8-0372]|uniref:hypothetical protein n=1 Tax=Solibacillus sp. FSL W8-0372 TaxID=2921713 RepID=UPI0030CE483E